VARARGVRVWIVGGAPRDSLLGLPWLDADVAVAGDAEALARDLEALGFGRAIAISRATPRVFRVAGKTPLDLAEIEGGSIEADLARRDFTANAVAIDLESGRWIDPFGGARDAIQRRLRLVRESNLAEDPLRVFRAARLYATHGLRPDRRTLEACRRAGSGLARVAPERLQAEVAKLLEASEVGRAFGWAERAGLLSRAFGLRRPAGRWRRAARNLARLDPMLGRPSALPDRMSLRLAAIALGLRLSPRQAMRWLGARRFSRAQAGSLARLLDAVRAARAARSADARWAWVHDAGPAACNALALLERIDGQSGRRVARRLRRLLERQRSRPRVAGADLIEWLGVSTGPAIGRLLREVRIAVLRGDIRTRAQARRWAVERGTGARTAQIPKIVRPSVRSS